MDIRVLNTPLPEDLLKLKWNGQFELMNQIIDQRLQKDLPSMLKERLESLDFKVSEPRQIGPTIGAHVGPEAFGIIYLEK